MFASIINILMLTENEFIKKSVSYIPHLKFSHSFYINLKIKYAYLRI